MIRFLVDECTGPAVAAWLRNGNYEVFSVFEEGRGMDDEDVIQKALKEEWILTRIDCQTHSSWSLRSRFVLPGGRQKAVSTSHSSRAASLSAEFLDFPEDENQPLKRQAWLMMPIPGFKRRPLVRQAKLGVSCRVQVPAGQGLASHPYRVLRMLGDGTAHRRERM